jgi:galactonate dehydratase
VVAGAHVMMSTPNFYRLETSRWDLSSYNVFIAEPLDNSGGRLKMPSKPGLGIEMNMEFLRGNVVDGFGGS